MKKQEMKSQAQDSQAAVADEPRKKEPKSITDRDFYDRVFALHGTVRNEMRRRQIAGEKWRSLHPVEQQLFIILQRMKMFLTREV
jgi:hypothetical protein